MQKRSAGGVGMKRLVRPLLWGIFVVYCLVLINVLFIIRPVRPGLSYADYFREYTNFIPLKTIVDFARGFLTDIGWLPAEDTVLPRGWLYYLVNLIGNFVLFLPMGLALPCLFKKSDRFWKVTLIVAGLVILVELTQGLLRVGSIDVDDVIFNMCGGMLGYGVYKLLRIGGFWDKIGVCEC